MSVRLDVNNSAIVRDFDYTPGMTVGDLVKNFKETASLRWKGDPVVQDSSQGRVMNMSDRLVDGRYYTMQVWLNQQVGEDGLTNRQRDRA